MRTELDHIFQYIDKSQVPSGYLDEYGPQFADKKWYTGLLADSNFIESLPAFRFLYNDIEQARIYTNAPVLTPLDAVNNSIQQLSAANSTSLIFLIAKYANTKEDAINLNLFSNNGNNQVLDVAGRNQSPYIENNFFAACPVSPDAAQKNVISLSYNPSLAFTNCGKIINSVAVDFLKGAGYQIIAPNSSVNYTYTDSSGLKKFAIRVQCTDGSIYYCYSQQFVTVTAVNTSINARYGVFTDIEIANPAITIPAISGEHFGAKVYIRYSTKRKGTALENKLVKPFVVVEGYDLHDAAPSLGRKANYDINALITEWNNLYKESSYDLSKALDEQAGYDLVFVDYFTMDYIENNAKMLEKVIDQLNAMKVNNEAGVREKNVIMGISLGGVLSRYTLAKMTKNRGTNSTDTRLYISYDSPHQGGNVPLGFQHFLQDFGELQILGKKFKDNIDQLKEFYNLNSQPATSQLLLLRVLNGTGTVVNNTFFAQGGPYRTMVDFTPAEMATTPPLYEFKAISQGSECGNWVMQPNTILCQYNENISTVRFVLMGLVLSKYRISLKVNSLPPQGTSSQISYLRMQRNIKLFWGAIGTGWVTTKEFTRNFSGNEIPWDGVPGGTSSASGRSGGQFGGSSTIPDFNKSNTFFGDVLRLLLHVYLFNVNTNINILFQQDNFTTVPINSSLDLQNVSSSTFSQTYVFPINGLAGSRSIKYIANEKFTSTANGTSVTLYNYEHADFTNRQSQWMFNEMEGIPSTLDCSTDCSFNTFTIDGADALCTSSAYKITGLAPNTTITWSVYPSSIASINVASNVATLTAIGRGSATLTATFTVCGSSRTISKNLQVAGSGSNYSISVNGNTNGYFLYCANTLYTFTITNASSANNFNWTVPAGWTLQYTNGSECVIKSPNSTSPADANLTCTFNNACGGQVTTSKYLIYSSSACTDNRFKVYPNPASTYLYVEVDHTYASYSTQIYAVEIVDNYGTVRYSYNIPWGTTSHYISSLYTLQNGYYTIRIYDGTSWSAKQFTILQD